jgi:hypothetical protein
MTIMTAIPVEIDEIGTASIMRSWHKNRFTIRWGKRPDGTTDDWVYINCNDGVWEVLHQQKADSVVINLPVNKRFAGKMVATVLENEDCRESLEKWRKNTLRRLNSAVPRFEKKLAESLERRNVLKDMSFT